MKWFYNLGIRGQIMSGFIIMAIVAVAIGLTAVSNIRTIHDFEQQTYEQSTVPMQQIQQASIYLQKIRVNTKNISGTQDPAKREQYKEQNKEYFVEVDALLAAYGTTVTNGEEQQVYNQLITKYHELTGMNAKVFALIESGQEQAALTVVETQAQPVADEIDRLIEQLQAMKLDQAKQLVTRTENLTTTTARNMIIIFLVGASLALVIGFYISRKITNPLHLVSNIAQSVAGRDLNVQVPENKYEDEIGNLLKTFHQMVDNLRAEISQIVTGVNVLATSVSEISTSAMQFNASATETDLAVSETTTTIEELRQTVKVSSQKANYISDIAQKAVQDSAIGQKAVEETVTKINQISAQMNSITESIVKLSERSQAIGEIIASVDDIAEQTNLLAVNASIEAAKAGEQGKGFAVVAQEIKSLAGQSKQATAQVRTILNDIQRATNSAVLETEQGSKAVEAGVLQAVKAGESIKAMTQTISETAHAVTQIATSSQQQFAGTEQAALAMENIRQASRQNLDSARQLGVATKDLDELGKNLKQLVEQYKL